MNKLSSVSNSLTLLNYLLDPEMSDEFKRTITSKKASELLKEASESLSASVQYVQDLEDELNDLQNELNYIKQ